MNNEIIIFENQKIKLEVNMKDETVWLSLDQLAQLFDRDKSVISRHIKNVLEEELDNSVVAKFATTASDGKSYQVDYYNLDMIISVGYRVKSKEGIAFRKWANQVLKDYMLKGYAVNQKRLEYLEKTVKLIDIAGRIDYQLKGEEAQGIIKVINKPKGKNSDDVIKYEDCIEVISKLKFNSDSNLFGLGRNKGLSSIINDVYQSFDGVDVYPSVEEKAVNFLYLITKNHTFIDGNKRIAATLFIYFLNFYNILYKDGVQVIDNNTLVAITLLIAQSNPREKDILVDLVMNFLE